MQKVYLLRHFKVIDNKKSFLSANEFNEWIDEYDNLELKSKEIELKDFNKVLVSPLNRTIKTAKYLNLNFEILNELKEVENVKFNLNIKLPKFLWLIISRVLWRFNLSNSENYRDTQKRVKKVLKIIEENDDILLISHGFFMKEIIKKLKEKGFNGEKILKPKGGKIYKFSI